METHDRESLLGAHFSISGGLDQAVYEAARYQCSALQLFTANARTWKERDLSQERMEAFHAAVEKTRISATASHTSYLINLAGPDRETRLKSQLALCNELNRSARLRIHHVVLHPGAHLGSGRVRGISRLAQGIREILCDTAADGPRLLLETTSGQGTGIGHTFEDLADILDQTGSPDRMGICMDTCHIFAAGYDIRTPEAYARTLEAFHKRLGLKYLYLIHLNDSKNELGTRVDRHEHIGEGHIGKTGFACFMNDKRLAHIPKILETPKTKKTIDMDRQNLETLKAMIIG